jgi:chromosome segregation protein
MKDLDLWGATHRYLGFMAEDRVLRASIEQRGQRQGEVKVDIEQRELLLEQRRLDAAQEERRLGGLQEKLYELDNRIKLTESSAEFHDRESAELTERSQAAVKEIEAIDEQSAALASSMEQARVETETLATSCQTEVAALAEAEATYRTVREELGQVQAQIDRAKAEHAALGAQVARDENHVEGLGRRVADLDRRLARLAEEAQKLGDRWEVVHAETTRLSAALGGLRQLRLALGERREEQEARLADLRQHVQRGEVELETLRTELHRRRSRLTSLQEIAQRYEGFQRGVRAIMQHEDAPRDGVRALVADIIDAPAEYEAAAEAVLGERLGNIIVADHEVGLRAIEFLKSRAEGRSSFIPVEVRLPDAPEAPAVAAAPVRPADVLAMELGDVEVAGDGLTAVGETELRPIAVAAAAEPTVEAAAERAAFADVIRRVAERGGLGEDESVPEEIRTVTRELGAQARDLASRLSAPGVRGRLIDLCGYDRDYERVAEFLLGDVVVVEELEQALSLWRGFDGAGSPTLVTLDGEVVDPHGVITGGSRERSGAGVLQQKREMRELEEIIAGLEQDLAQALARHVTLKADVAETAQAVEDLKRDSHSGEMDILTNEKDLGRGRQELEQLASRRRHLEDEQGELDAAKDEAARERDETITRLEAARGRVEVLAQDLARLGEEGQGLLGRVDAAAARATELKVRVAMAQEKREAAQRRRGQLEAQAKEHAARRERLGRQRAEGVDRAAALRAQVAEERTQLLALAAESAERTQELEAGRAAYETKQAEMQHEEAELKGLRRALAEVGEELQALELKLHDLEASRARLEETIFDRYRLELRRELGGYHLRPQVGPKEEARLKELRELIDRMGEVNLTAIEEYEELKLRFEFKAQQKADVESALDQVTKAIAKINRASKQRFRETFDAVNAKFQEVFPRLFQGGRAWLQLTDENDLLETGVEIFAHPPGKKPGSIELLSGGEKALTAVSLVFAIFLVKPSPFCVLDEVDAPLDEANVGRCGDLIKEMTDQSQFIFITHNKRTMALADMLYGVTMQEPGVSKMVSVNLSRTQQQVA